MWSSISSTVKRTKYECDEVDMAKKKKQKNNYTWAHECSQHMLAHTVPVHAFRELSDCKAYLTGTHIVQARSGVNFLLSLCLASSFQQGRDN